MRWAARGFPRFGFLALGLAFFLAGFASQEVKFPSASPFRPVTLPGYLYRPKGTGPFPGLVLLHTCAGLGRHVFDWAARLEADGYVALAVDSFSPRGIKGGCALWTYSPSEAVSDAFGALAYLRSLPFVDRDRIGVMGWSFGAMAALRAGSELVGRAREPDAGGFRAAVAFYPQCPGSLAEDTIPVLLLLGGADDWSPDYQCLEPANDIRQEGGTAFWKVYRGAHHGFDQAELGHRAHTIRGHTLKYDPAATADAWKRIRAFLDQYLRKAP